MLSIRLQQNRFGFCLPIMNDLFSYIFLKNSRQNFTARIKFTTSVTNSVISLTNSVTVTSFSTSSSRNYAFAVTNSVIAVTNSVTAIGFSASSSRNYASVHDQAGSFDGLGRVSD
ncbi:MAG: hypothetical protein JNN15_09675 [Blastocatellia bacterium]|nr:hypothetical protein [Blastocatellia bacterium]